MLDTKSAKEFFIVGWCKDWSVIDYLKFIDITVKDDMKGSDWADLEKFVSENLPWLPKHANQFKTSIKVFVGSAYPRLSAWLFSRDSDVARLKCADQLSKLKPPDRLAKVSVADRVEMKSASKDERNATASYRLS